MKGHCTIGQWRGISEEQLTHCSCLDSVKNRKMRYILRVICSLKSVEVFQSHHQQNSAVSVLPLLRLCHEVWPEDFVQTASPNLFWHIQIASTLNLESLRVKKQTKIHMKSDANHIWWWFETRFQMDFYRCVSVWMLWSLLSDFRVFLKSLNCDTRQHQIQSDGCASEPLNRIHAMDDNTENNSL